MHKYGFWELAGVARLSSFSSDEAEESQAAAASGTVIPTWACDSILFGETFFGERHAGGNGFGSTNTMVKSMA
jgi:hypothetical protein